MSSVHTKLLDNRYEVLLEIKSGAMGCVYKAKDIRLGNIVALKQMISNYRNPEETKYLEQSFKEEAALLSRLHHGGVPKVTDYFMVRDPVRKTTSYYIAMTFIEGKDLDTIISERNKRPFPIETALDYFYQILDILKYLHSQPTPIIYRDLKPSNIIVNEDKVFLVDFGVAQMADLQNGGMMTGTEGYMSPEQTQGFADERSDLYSLGVLIHYLVTGMDPQEGIPYTFESARKLNPGVPEALDAIISSLLDLVPANRPQSARKVMQLLDLSSSKEDTGSTVVSEILEDSERKTFRDYQDIFEAIEKSNINAVKEFVFMGTDVNARDRDHWTPLHRMIEIGNREISELLISKDADINAETHKGWTPLHVAAICGQDDVAELLLIEGADKDRQDSDGWTPLHWAANQGHHKLVKLFLSWGVRIKAQDNDKWTPLHWAVMRNNLEIVKMLTGAGADPNCEFSDGSMPLHIALAADNLDMIKYLIASGADVNAPDRSHFGERPLHCVDKSNKDLIDFLIKKGASIEKCDDLGRTPLYGLSEKDVDELLIRNGIRDRYSGRCPDDSLQADGNMDMKRWTSLLRKEIISLWTEICLSCDVMAGADHGSAIVLKSEDMKMRFGIESCQTTPQGSDNTELTIRFIPVKDCCYTDDGAVEGRIDESGFLSAEGFGLPSREYLLSLNLMFLRHYRAHFKKAEERSEKAKSSPEPAVKPGTMAPSRAAHTAAGAPHSRDGGQAAAPTAVKTPGKSADAQTAPHQLRKSADPEPQAVKESAGIAASSAHRHARETSSSALSSAPHAAGKSAGPEPVNAPEEASASQPSKSAAAAASDTKPQRAERGRMKMFSSGSHKPPTAEEINDICNAAAKNDVDRIKVLLKQNQALVDCKTDVGTSPLHWTASGGAVDAMDLLISEGADINSRDNLGLTPLHLARSRAVAEKLLAHGAGIDAKSDYERTPLHCAAGSGNTEIVEYLLSKGADINAVNKKGETALDVAKKFRKNELVNILYAHGAKD
jgi:ankyrin repeat protein/tRNA A-37 threonylcarbamoyl transferase component Bud32